MIDDSLSGLTPAQRLRRQGDLPAPPRLTFIRPCGVPNERFADLAEAAARIQGLRGRRGLTVRRSQACYSGSVTFEAAALYVTPEGQATDDWLGQLVLPWSDLPTLQAALRAAAAARRPVRRAA